MTFFFIPWRPVISRFAQNAAHHSCSSVFKASVGCPIFPRLDAQTVDARKPLPTTTTGHLRIATKQAPPVLISSGYLHCAPEAISESWIRYSRFGPVWWLEQAKTQHWPFLSHPEALHVRLQLGQIIFSSEKYDTCPGTFGLS